MVMQVPIKSGARQRAPGTIQTGIL